MRKKKKDKYVERVEEFIREKRMEIATEFQSWLITDLEECYIDEREISSPVEQLFFIEYHARKFRSHWSEDMPFFLMPQHSDKSTGKYRLDFLIDFTAYVMNTQMRFVISDETACRVECPKLAIEIDGHIWHEKTKEQVQYHKERERFLVANGWQLLRFTGSEVYKNPSKCLDEVIEVAEPLATAWHIELKEFENKKK